MRVPTAIQTGQRGLPLMILHQHEAARVGSEVPLGTLGPRRDDRLAVGCQPALTAVTACTVSTSS